MPFPAGSSKDLEPESPAVPKDSATVVLLREGATGPEVFLQRRVAGMAFAGGMTVFPGGGVDSADADSSIEWLGPRPRQWARWFGCPEPTARALVCAAVREVFEESGVLLAGDDTGVVADTARYEQARESLASRETSLAVFLAEAGLMLRADLLRPWANWITPEQESRRYDTRFFVARLPRGQHPDDATSEAEHSVWQTPAQAIEDARAGRSMLLPPTRVTLEEIGEFDTVEDVLAAERSVVAIEPRMRREGDRMRVVIDE